MMKCQERRVIWQSALVLLGAPLFQAVLFLLNGVSLETHYQDLVLDMPQLEPAAAQCALFEENPAPGYKQRMKGEKRRYDPMVLTFRYETGRGSTGLSYEVGVRRNGWAGLHSRVNPVSEKESVS